MMGRGWSMIAKKAGRDVFIQLKRILIFGPHSPYFSALNLKTLHTAVKPHHYLREHKRQTETWRHVSRAKKHGVFNFLFPKVHGSLQKSQKQTPK